MKCGTLRFSEGKLRVILFLSLVTTLSSVKGQDFEFNEHAYAAALDSERIHDVEFKPNDEIFQFDNDNRLHEWFATEDVIQEGGTITRTVLKQPRKMSTIDEGLDTDVEFLSHILISFSKVSYTRPSVWKPDIVEEHELTYGKLAICFIDEARYRGLAPESNRETCLYTLMFACPMAWCHQEYMRASNAVGVDPISEEQIDRLTLGQPMKWKLDSLPSTLLLSPTSKAYLRDTEAAPTSNLAKSLIEGGAAFYLQPIIVRVAVLEKYYEFVTKRN